MALARAAEQVQMVFLRGVLGLHANGSGVSDAVIRAEVGCEPLADRWAKLKLGYWRRIFNAEGGRLLRHVGEFRHTEWVASGGRGYGRRGWMRTAHNQLHRHGRGRRGTTQR